MLPGLAGIGGLAAGKSGGAVGFDDGAVSASVTDTSPITATLKFGSDRTISNQAGAVLQEWLADGYSAASYQVRATVLSGTAPSGASLATWLSLSSSRSWSLTESDGKPGVTSCTLKIEVRDAAAPNTVRDSATFTITADSAGVVVTAIPSSINASGSTSTIVTDPVTASASGGVAPYSFVWSWQDNLSGMTIGSPSSATTAFTKAGTGTGESYFASARCDVTDAVGASGHVFVPVTVQRT